MKPPYVNAHLLTQCGVKFVPFDEKPIKCSFYYNAVRFFVMHKYLKEHAEIDRVFLSDLDVVFQADPFNLEVGDNELILASEGQTFMQSRPNKKWMHIFIKRFGEKGEIPLKKYMSKKVLNQGTFYGKRPTLIKYYDMYIDRFHRHAEYPRGLCGLGYDQTFLNAVIYNDVFHGEIKFTFPEPTDANISYPHVIADRVIAQNKEFGRLMIENSPSHFVLAMHGWDKDARMKELVRAKCGVLFPADKTRCNPQIA